MDEAVEDEGWEHVVQPPSQRGEEQSTAFPAGEHECALHPHSCPSHLDVEEEEEEEEERGWMRWMFSGSARRSIRSGLEMVYSRIPATLGTRWPGRGGGGRLLPFAAVVVLMWCLMHQRRRHRRERELFGLRNKAKDKRISQLLDQIALMNEMIAARSRVPILRRL